MAYYPLATEFNAYYRLVGADGVSVAVFNDPTDANYVGALTEVTGLDSAEVREAASDLPEADGGAHGAFYLGRRPITLSGRVFGHATVAERNLRLDRARRASLALRGDSTLFWKPSTRRENLLRNPSFEIDTSSWAIYQNAATGTLSRTTAQFRTGTAAAQLAVTAGGAGSSLGAATSIASAAPASPGQVFSTAGYVRSSVSRPAQSILAFYTAAGTFIQSFSGSTIASSTTGWLRTPALTATAPAGSAFVTAYVSFNNVAAGENHFIDDVMLNMGSSVDSYFDGNTTGFYWNGDAHNSTSGDFIEQFTTVRRAAPFRESGQWVKEFQIPLVSEYAYIFGSAVKTVAAGVAAENRGNMPAYPVVSITGASANPTVSDGTRTFRTTGLSGGSALAAGETVEFDMLSHSGKFTAGARNGQSANRFIDWATTGWPYLTGLGTTQTFTLTGGGTLSVRYRDAWA